MWATCEGGDGEGWLHEYLMCVPTRIAPACTQAPTQPAPLPAPTCTGTELADQSLIGKEMNSLYCLIRDCMGRGGIRKKERMG